MHQHATRLNLYLIQLMKYKLSSNRNICLGDGGSKGSYNNWFNKELDKIKLQRKSLDKKKRSS